MLAQLDKNILVLMVAPIQKSYGVTDVEISFLIGAAFAIANIGVGIPAGWMADKWNRRAIIAAGVIIWSLALSANVLASTFFGLVVARVIVGGAEALIPPSSYSLIRDGVDEDSRARALSSYTMALMLGTGLSLVLGGPLLAAVHNAGWTYLPIIGHVNSWQFTLFLIGAVGLPLALAVFLNRDPGRTPATPGALEESNARAASLPDYLWKNRAFFVPVLVFVVANAIVTFGMAAWLPAMAGRKFLLEMRTFGLSQGVIMLTAGPLGLWLAGVAMQKKRANNPLARIMSVGLVSSLAMTVMPTALVLATSLQWFWTINCFVVLSSWTFMSVTSVVIARTVPAASVGLVMAVVLFVNGLVGQGFSPTLIALVGRYVYGGGEQALPYAMATVFFVAGCLASLSAMRLVFVVQRKTTSSVTAEYQNSAA
jgi:MFS family permease